MSGWQVVSLSDCQFLIVLLEALSCAHGSKPTVVDPTPLVLRLLIAVLRILRQVPCLAISSSPPEAIAPRRGDIHTFRRLLGFAGPHGLAGGLPTLRSPSLCRGATVCGVRALLPGAFVACYPVLHLCLLRRPLCRSLRRFEVFRSVLSVGCDHVFPAIKYRTV